MLCLCDFFNQRGDLYEKAKGIAAGGLEGKKFFLAIDLDKQTSFAQQIVKALFELSHSCPGLHLVFAMPTKDSDDEAVKRLTQDGKMKHIKVARLSEK